MFPSFGIAAAPGDFQYQETVWPFTSMTGRPFRVCGRRSKGTMPHQFPASLLGVGQEGRLGDHRARTPMKKRIFTGSQGSAGILHAISQGRCVTRQALWRSGAHLYEDRHAATAGDKGGAVERGSGQDATLGRYPPGSLLQPAAKRAGIKKWLAAFSSERDRKHLLPAFPPLTAQ